MSRAGPGGPSRSGNAGRELHSWPILSTLESLLANTASVTSTLAERDEVISSLIDNLNVVLDNLGDRDQELSQLILTFKTFVGGLNDDSDAILDSLDQISSLSVQTASLVNAAASASASASTAVNAGQMARASVSICPGRSPANSPCIPTAAS